MFFKKILERVHLFFGFLGGKGGHPKKMTAIKGEGVMRLLNGVSQTCGFNQIEH